LRRRRQAHGEQDSAGVAGIGDLVEGFGGELEVEGAPRRGGV
jgi:hypothetical protein